MVSQNDVENKVLIQENINYDNFRMSWYGSLSLLDINYAEESICRICGESTDIVICDATTIGFKRKFIAERLASAKKVKSDAKYVPKFIILLPFNKVIVLLR